MRYSSYIISELGRAAWRTAFYVLACGILLVVLVTWERPVEFTVRIGGGRIHIE